MVMRHIHVFGGARGIGRWFVEYVLKSTGLTISVYDIDPPSDPPEAANITTYHISYHQGRIAGTPVFAPSDMVILAVPIHTLQATCGALFPMLPDGCMVLDMSSVKTSPHAIMEEYASGRLSLLGMHPLFGPSVVSPVGQIVVLTGFQEQDERHHWFGQMLTSRGFLVEKTTPETHDDYMLAVQVLTHFLLLTFARVLASSKHSLAALLNVRTPPFTFLSAFAGRLLGSNAVTYANIQRLAGAAQVRAAIRAAVDELDRQFAPDTSLDLSVQSIQQLGAAFSMTEISECFTISSRAIDSVQQIEQRFFSLVETGQLCAIQRISSGSISVGKIRSVSADRLVFEERTKKIKHLGRYAVCANDQARKQYASLGIVFGPFKQLDLLKRSIRVLEDEELQVWLQANILTIQRDINIKAPAALTPIFYERFLPQLVPGLAAVKYIELYHGAGQEDKATLSISHWPDVLTQDLIQQIDTILAQIARGQPDMPCSQAVAQNATTRHESAWNNTRGTT